MRCINMKIIDVLLVLINLMAVHSNVILQNKTSQPIDNGNLNKFERDCPDLWKILKSNNLTEWTNYQNIPATNKEITEEKVLQFAGFLAKKMFIFICDNKLQITDSYLRVRQNNTICPFQFSSLIDLGHDFENSLTKELKNEEHCSKVCEDLYGSRIQCVILDKLNKYLLSQEQQIRRVGLVQPDIPQPSESHTPTVKTDKVDNEPIEQKTSQALIKSKTEASNKDTTGSIKAQTNETKIPEPNKFKSEKLIGTLPKSSEKLEVSKTGLEIHEDESKELNIKNEDLMNPEKNAEYDDVMYSPNGSLKGEVSELTEVQAKAWGDANDKVRMSHNRKDTSSRNGFLQAEDSHFFFYFVVVSSLIVIGYIGFHNKNKILAYALEGTSGRRNRRRPNPARYRKLETNLEEVISSNTSDTVASSVVY